MNNYYGLEVALMDTDARVRVHGDTGQLRGVFVGKDLAEFDAATLAKWEDDGSDVVNVTVRDNGECGDGLSMMFTTPRRKDPRDPKGRNDDLLFAIDLTPTQARVLAAALKAAVSLRIAARVSDDVEAPIDAATFRSADHKNKNPGVVSVVVGQEASDIDSTRYMAMVLKDGVVVARYENEYEALEHAARLK